MPLHHADYVYIMLYIFFTFLYSDFMFQFHTYQTYQYFISFSVFIRLYLFFKSDLFIAPGFAGEVLMP